MAKASTDTEQTVNPAEPAELPAQLYVRNGGAPNLRQADVENAAANVGQWFRIVEPDIKAAKRTDSLIRRAGKVLSVKVSVKLPQTEKGSVYFRVVPASETEGE